MKLGQIIKNIHTGKTYTVVGVDCIKYEDANIMVYEIANDNFESHRFNSHYLKHYELVDGGE